MKQRKQHDNMKMRGDKVTHRQGERVKIPILMNKVRIEECFWPFYAMTKFQHLCSVMAWLPFQKVFQLLDLFYAITGNVIIAWFKCLYMLFQVTK